MHNFKNTCDSLGIILQHWYSQWFLLTPNACLSNTRYIYLYTVIAMLCTSMKTAVFSLFV